MMCGGVLASASARRAPMSTGAEFESHLQDGHGAAGGHDDVDEEMDVDDDEVDTVESTVGTVLTLEGTVGTLGRGGPGGSTLPPVRERT